MTMTGWQSDDCETPTIGGGGMVRDDDTSFGLICRSLLTYITFFLPTHPNAYVYIGRLLLH